MPASLFDALTTFAEAFTALGIDSANVEATLRLKIGRRSKTRSLERSSDGLFQGGVVTGS
jgi:hypothetical protein